MLSLARLALDAVSLLLFEVMSPPRLGLSPGTFTRESLFVLSELAGVLSPRTLSVVTRAERGLAFTTGSGLKDRTSAETDPRRTLRFITSGRGAPVDRNTRLGVKSLTLGRTAIGPFNGTRPPSGAPIDFPLVKKDRSCRSV